MADNEWALQINDLMFNIVKSNPIELPHVPDVPDEHSIREVLAQMTWGVCYRLTDRVSVQDDKPDLNAEMGLCWIDTQHPEGATVYIDGKPFCFQNAEWIQKQFEQRSGRVAYNSNGSHSTDAGVHHGSAELYDAGAPDRREYQGRSQLFNASEKVRLRADQSGGVRAPAGDAGGADTDARAPSEPDLQMGG